MSSLRNAVKGNKVYKERHQPAARQHLGLLEKHRDYKLRANEHNKKKHQLRALQRKASNRNPDEFYFHMVKSRAKEGRHHELIAEDESELPEEQVALLQSQDLRYIRHRSVVERNKLRRLTAQLHLLDGAQNTHTFFASTKKEASTMNVCERLDTVAQVLDRPSNRPRRSQLAAMAPIVAQVSPASLEKMHAAKKERYCELTKRLERSDTLTLMERRMEIKRHLMDKRVQKPKRVQPGSATSAPVYKWKPERKR